jgi:hypothetical protein
MIRKILKIRKSVNKATVKDKEDTFKHGLRPGLNKVRQRGSGVYSLQRGFGGTAPIM